MSVPCPKFPITKKPCRYPMDAKRFGSKCLHCGNPRETCWRVGCDNMIPGGLGEAFCSERCRDEATADATLSDVHHGRSA